MRIPGKFLSKVAWFHLCKLHTVHQSCRSDVSDRGQSRYTTYGDQHGDDCDNQEGNDLSRDEAFPWVESGCILHTFGRKGQQYLFLVWVWAVRKQRQMTIRCFLWTSETLVCVWGLLIEIRSEHIDLGRTPRAFSFRCEKFVSWERWVGRIWMYGLKCGAWLIWRCKIVSSQYLRTIRRRRSRTIRRWRSPGNERRARREDVHGIYTLESGTERLNVELFIPR